MSNNYGFYAVIALVIPDDARTKVLRALLDLLRYVRVRARDPGRGICASAKRMGTTRSTLMIKDTLAYIDSVEHGLEEYQLRIYRGIGGLDICPECKGKVLSFLSEI